jgi:predicted PurR-regulated permease PerM
MCRCRCNERPPPFASARSCKLAHTTNRGDSRLFGIVAAVVVVAALYFARIIFVPLALAILLSLLLTPAVQRLERWHFPRLLAIVLVVGTLIGAAAVIVWQTSPQFADFIDYLPSYEKAVQDKIDTIKGSTGERLADASNSVKALFNEITGVVATTAPAKKAAPGTPGRPLAVQVEPPPNPLESVRTILGPIASALVVIVFAVFILLGREDLRNRFIRLAYGGRLNAMTQAMDDAVSRINRYLFLQLLVNCSFGALIWIGLHFIGIPNAALWGLCAAVLRYLPYIGAPSAAIMPIFLSLAEYPGWQHVALTAGLFIVLEVVIANFVEPTLYSSHIGLSPLAILVAAVFWTLIWGFPGLVLSTPLTVCLVVIGQHVPSLSFLDILLGNEPVLPPHALYYQRLLAGDQNEARQIAELYLKDNDLAGLYGKVMIPALGLAEQDRHRDQLDPDTSQFIYQSTREILADIDGSNNAEETEEEAAQTHAHHREFGRNLILCVPARDEADDVVAGLLAQLLESHGEHAQCIGLASTSEMLGQIADYSPHAICISALPPFALNHARELYGKLRTRFPGLKIAVCLWHFEGDLDRVAARLRLAKNHHIFTMLTDAVNFFSGKPTETEAKSGAAQIASPAATARATTPAATEEEEEASLEGQTAEPVRPDHDSVLVPEPEATTEPEPIKEPEPTPMPATDPPAPPKPKRDPSPRPVPQREPSPPPDSDPSHEPVREPDSAPPSQHIPEPEPQPHR